MLRATLKNYTKYNFHGSLRNELEYNRDNSKHTENYILMKNHLENTVNTIKFFGNDAMTQDLLKEIVTYIKYSAMNFHLPKVFYSLMNQFQDYSSSSYPNTNRGIEIVSLLIETIPLNENAKDFCPHGCCK